MFAVTDAKIRILAITGGLAFLAGCATPPAPTPPPPPPPKVVQVVIPARPMPPSGAVAIMTIPAVGTDGLRRTVNHNISSAQKVWNMRSALNVAALNCLDSRYSSVLTGYKLLLDRHKKGLAAANKDVTSEFRSRYGATGRTAQDQYMTQVYNYFALPPAQHEFCVTATRIADELPLVAAADLESFSVRSLQSFEAVFEDFYRSYERYQSDLAQWDARYGSLQSANPATFAANASYGTGTTSEQADKTDFVSGPLVAPRP